MAFVMEGRIFKNYSYEIVNFLTTEFSQSSVKIKLPNKIVTKILSF
jgi:hypothetical protein